MGIRSWWKSEVEEGVKRRAHLEEVRAKVLSGESGSKAGKVTTKAASKAAKEELSAAEKKIADATRKAVKEAEAKELKNVLSKIENPTLRYRIGRDGMWQALKDSGKKNAGKGALATLGIAAVVGLGALWARSRRNNARMEQEGAIEAGRAQLEAERAQMQMMQEQALAGPADGRAPNEWQSRVRPGASPQLAAQPSLTVSDAPVQDLNAPTPGRA